MCVQLSANRCNSSQHCANGCNNSQQCWELQCIMGRIQPIRLWRPCVTHVRVPNNFGKAVQTAPTLLRYASAIMEQIRMLRSCWLKSLTGFKLCATTTNNMQQHATGCANGCTPWNPTMLHAFAPGFEGKKSNKNDVILCGSMVWYNSDHE